MKTIREVDAYLRSKKFVGGYEIVVADSASRDHTLRVVEELKGEVRNLRTVSVERRGKGLGVKAGMLAARGDVRLFSDADNSTAPKYFDAMEPLLASGYPIVISSRDPKDVTGASRDIKEPWYRELLGNLGNLVIQVVGIWGIWDTQNGFKAFTAEAAREIFHRTIIRGWAFDIEVLTLARRLGFHVAVIPIQWRYDPDSKLSLGAYLEVLADVFHIRWNLLTGRYRS